MIDKATQIARKEWENLRHSFEMCGDIGDFSPEDLNISKLYIGQEYEGSRLRSNIIEMDKKLSRCGYATLEALNAFTTLATRAVERLGLKEELASAFGMGYGFVRTGLVAYHTLEPKQILFYKMFFPLGGTWDLYCDIYPDLYPNLIKKKLKIVFERFRSWQNNPLLYTQDFEQFQSINEAWKEWEEINK